MISFEAALKIVLDATPTLAAKPVLLRDAAGYIAAENIESPISIPLFDNSAMDGFAVRAADTADAATNNPLELKVARVITAGDAPTEPLAPGTCCEIMTGATIPSNSDAVIPVEQVEIIRDASEKPVRIRIRQASQSGRNLRRSGEDFGAGTRLLAAGEEILAEKVMGLAAAGIEAVACRFRPRAQIITTGNELSGDGTLAPGIINDSNGPYLSAILPTCGATVIKRGRTRDRIDELCDFVAASRDETDIVISTGGVSAGRMDFVPSALEQLGADILFHRVAIRPGKPLLFARLPDGRLFFGLPGNPIAVAVGMRFFIAPALRKMRGLPIESFPRAILRNAAAKKPGLTFFAKAVAGCDDTSRLVVDILPGQESFKIAPLMAANCWAIGDESANGLSAGDQVRIAPLATGLKL